MGRVKAEKLESYQRSWVKQRNCFTKKNGDPLARTQVSAVGYSRKSARRKGKYPPFFDYMIHHCHCQNNLVRKPSEQLTFSGLYVVLNYFGQRFFVFKTNKI